MPGLLIILWNGYRGGRGGEATQPSFQGIAGDRKRSWRRPRNAPIMSLNPLGQRVESGKRRLGMLERRVSEDPQSDRLSLDAVRKASITAHLPDDAEHSCR